MTTMNEAPVQGMGADAKIQLGARVVDSVVHPKFRGSWPANSAPPVLCYEGDYYILEDSTAKEEVWLMRRNGQWQTTPFTPQPYAIEYEVQQSNGV
jgi:hypothetical protein